MLWDWHKRRELYCNQLWPRGENRKGPRVMERGLFTFLCLAHTLTWKQWPVFFFLMCEKFYKKHTWQSCLDRTLVHSVVLRIIIHLPFFSFFPDSCPYTFLKNAWKENSFQPLSIYFHWSLDQNSPHPSWCFSPDGAERNSDLPVPVHSDLPVPVHWLCWLGHGVTLRTYESIMMGKGALDGLFAWRYAFTQGLPVYLCTCLLW